jgi:transcriptional regulator with XRE-family HTH domain
MLNGLDFTKRLKKIIDFHNVSASSFADKINVPRSSISHILSGRNKPSLEFILKVIGAFENVDINWLLFGTGNFPKTTPLSNLKKQISNAPELTVEKNIPFEKIPSPPPTTSIEKIVIFYTDGTFKDFSEK